MLAEIILVVTTYVYCIVDALSFAKYFLPLKLATPLEVDMI